MTQGTKGPMQIRRRLTTGWSDLVQNRDPKRCDVDGALLWIGPGDQVYCDSIHALETQAPNKNPAAQTPKQ